MRNFLWCYYSPRGYSHTLPIRVCAAYRGRDFEAPGLERENGSDAVSRTGYNISNARKLSTFVSSHLKAFKDRLQGRI